MQAFLLGTKKVKTDFAVSEERSESEFCKGSPMAKHKNHFEKKSAPLSGIGLKWRMRAAEEDLSRRLAESTGCFPETARILVSRGIAGIKAFRDFLYPTLQGLPHPDGLQDLPKAADRILLAMERQEKILIFGDYDADGITATVLLYSFLSRFYPHVFFYLPHREKEGYGLGIEQVTAFSKKGIRLIITVDCGITSHGAVEEAGKRGLDVIVTDHHRPGNTLPEACAVVDPGREDCASGLDDLAGVGVSFYLAMAIRTKLREKGFWQKMPEPRLIEESDLVALGTVADLVPLTGINRILVREGILQMRKNPRPGIEALCRVAGLSFGEMSSEHIAYRIGPRINAAGRMAHPEIAAQLLLAPSVETAMPLAMELDKLNAARQLEENRILEEIESSLQRKPERLSREVLIFHGKDWPLGTIGIAASRLVKKFHRPVILISIRQGLGFASARSIPGFDLYRALDHCKDYLEQFGGHGMAAGFRILPEKISPLEESMCAFAAAFRDIIGFPPPLYVDAPLSLDAATPKLLEEIETIGPFGMENPLPLFVAENLDVIHQRPLGKDEAHRRLVLRQMHSPSGKTVQGVIFQAGKDARIPGRLSTCIFHLRKAWGKSDEVEIQIEGWE